MSRTIPVRADVPRETTWDLDVLFPTAEAWEEAFLACDREIPTLAAKAGTLGESVEAARATLDIIEGAKVRVGHVAVHARLSWAVDTGDAHAAERSERASGLVARFAAATAFVEPELLSLGTERLAAYAADPALAEFAHPLDRLRRRADHVRSPEVEEILIRAGEAFGAGRIHSAITDTDLVFGSATGTDGSSLEIGQGTIGKLLTDPDREVRRTAWERYADRHLELRNGLAAACFAGVRQNVFVARARGYRSPLHASLEANWIPVAVFENLVDAFVRHLPVWHRYWDLRAKVLGVGRLAPWDAKAPLVADGGPVVPYRQAVDWIAEGMEPLGSEYVAALRRGCGPERWVDVYPNRGKRMGAFSSGTFGTHPYILMSYNDDVFSLSTLAHEL
ncbi:MAG: M3 family oligoendopeptidase, partial [Armatimonadota bacterium]